jgi:hypothetical protein
MQMIMILDAQLPGMTLCLEGEQSLGATKDNQLCPYQRLKQNTELQQWQHKRALGSYDY